MISCYLHYQTNFLAHFNSKLWLIQKIPDRNLFNPLNSQYYVNWILYSENLTRALNSINKNKTFFNTVLQSHSRIQSRIFLTLIKFWHCFIFLKFFLSSNSHWTAIQCNLIDIQLNFGQPHQYRHMVHMAIFVLCTSHIALSGW